jgi:hypothetical protein
VVLDICVNKKSIERKLDAANMMSYFLQSGIVKAMLGLFVPFEQCLKFSAPKKKEQCCYFLYLKVHPITFSER